MMRRSGSPWVAAKNMFCKKLHAAAVRAHCLEAHKKKLWKACTPLHGKHDGLMLHQEGRGSFFCVLSAKRLQFPACLIIPCLCLQRANPKQCHSNCESLEVCDKVGKQLA